MMDDNHTRARAHGKINFFISAYAFSRSSLTMTRSKNPGSSVFAISLAALAMRTAMDASFSVPRPRRRLSSYSTLGGLTNRNRAFKLAAFLQISAPCTSMSRMQIFPWSATAATAASEVP